MRLVILDIDGTLTDTTQVDEHAIVGALQDVLGVSGLSTDWSDYEHSTDAGIVYEVIAKNVGSVPAALLGRVQDRFFEYMENFYTSSPDLFSAMPGAKQILRDLHDHGYAVAIATGSWRESALFKLRVAQIWHDNVNMATADDHVSRSSIIRKAIDDARKQYGATSFDEVIYVGDGAWDARASKNLGITFIGVANNGNSERLLQYGVETICQNLEEVSKLLLSRTVNN